MSESIRHSFQAEFDPVASCYRYHHDAKDSVKPSTGVVLALGSMTGERPREMPQLSESIAPESINYHVSDTGSTGTLSFEYHDHTVTVDHCGDIRFVPLQRSEYE